MSCCSRRSTESWTRACTRAWAPRRRTATASGWAGTAPATAQASTTASRPRGATATARACRAHRVSALPRSRARGDRLAGSADQLPPVPPRALAVRAQRLHRRVPPVAAGSHARDRAGPVRRRGGSTDTEVVFHLALTLGLESDPIGALERIESGGALRILDALFVQRDPATDDLSAIALHGAGAGGLVAPLLGFRLDAAERRRTSERTLAETDVQALGNALAPGEAAPRCSSSTSGAARSTTRSRARVERPSRGTSCLRRRCRRSPTGSSTPCGPLSDDRTAHHRRAGHRISAYPVWSLVSRRGSAARGRGVGSVARRH